jgi:hypothetical protein
MGPKGNSQTLSLLVFAGFSKRTSPSLHYPQRFIFRFWCALVVTGSLSHRQKNKSTSRR